MYSECDADDTVHFDPGEIEDCKSIEDKIVKAVIMTYISWIDTFSDPVKVPGKSNVYAVGSDYDATVLAQCKDNGSIIVKVVPWEE